MINGMQNIDPQAVQVPLNIIKTWENMLNTLSEVIRVPASLIMRAYPDEFEVVAVNDDNRMAHVGDRHNFGDGLFCEWVMTHKKELVVSDGRENDEWSDSPSVRHGLVSYMGYPILWPSGQFFGTICVLDEKNNDYSEAFKNLMENFKESIELSLYSIYISACLKAEVVRRKQAEAKLKIALSTARQLNEKILDAKNRVEHATHAQSELIRRITEEVQNPINSIDVYCSIIDKSESLSAEDRENVEVILHSVGKIKEIVDEMVGQVECEKI